MHFAIQNLMLHTHITVQIASCKQTADKILITAKYIGSILSKQASKHLQRALFVVLHFIMKKYIQQHGICLLYILCLCIARIILFYTILLYYNAQNATYGGVERFFLHF